MSITKDERLKNIDEMVNQYLSLIMKTINFISELLEERKELLKNQES